MSTESALAELVGYYAEMSLAALLRERTLLDAELVRAGAGERPFIEAQRAVLVAAIADRAGQSDRCSDMGETG